MPAESASQNHLDKTLVPLIAIALILFCTLSNLKSDLLVIFLQSSRELTVLPRFHDTPVGSMLSQ